ncbi:MAG: histidine phosphatase family protein [Spirochaetaceae bacterium]|nr:MAG: histidine phosphatase family protein [Spirochaetaceae bacterium]
MRILLIRHGDPDYANDTLTDRGWTEARALADYLADPNSEMLPQRLYVSPLGRARATASCSEERLGMTATVEEWTRELAELRMPNRGMMAWDLHGNIIRDVAAAADRPRWETVDELAALPYQETLSGIRDSSDEFMSRLGYVRNGHHYRVERRNDDTIAVFCHGGFGLTWLSVLLEIDAPLVWAGFFLPASSITTILLDEREDRIATPRCLGVGALPHLARAGLPMSGAGIKANLR